MPDCIATGSELAVTINMNAAVEVSVVIPALNEAENLAALVAEVSAAVANRRQRAAQRVASQVPAARRAGRERRSA